MTGQLEYDEYGVALCDIWDRRIISSTLPSEFCFQLPLEPQNPLFKGRRLEEMSDRSLPWQQFTSYTRTSPGVNPEAMAHVQYFLERVDVEIEMQKKNNGVLMSDIAALVHKIKTTFDENNTELHRQRPEDRKAILRIKKFSQNPVLKGLSGQYEIRWYMEKYGFSLSEAATCAVRAYMTSTYMATFWSDAGLHPKLLDACGALLCVTSLVDHCNTPDAERVGGLDIFMGAVADGLEVFNLAIPFIQEVFHDLIAVCAYMKLRDLNRGLDDPKVEATECTYSKTEDSGNSLGNPKALPRPAFFSPERFVQMRWWDAAVGPFTRIAVGFCNIDNVPAHDELGTPYCLMECHRVRRAVTNVYRYNDITDLISDFATGETGNELLIAFCAGGLEATKGYAEALAQVTEDAISCPCSVNTEDHIWGVVCSQSYCFWTGLRPRYMLMKQFHDAVNWQHETFGDREISAKRGGFLPGANRPVKLQESAVLHTNEWRPLWSFSGDSGSTETMEENKCHLICTTCEQSAAALTTRILMQPREKIESLHKTVKEIIYNIINPHAVFHSDIGDIDQGCVCYDPHSYAEIWQSICFELYNLDCLIKAPDVERTNAARNIYERAFAYCKILWRQTGKVEDPTFLDVAVHLDKEGDKVWFNTHDAKHYKDGTWRRQLLMGILTSLLELSPLRAYSRVCNYHFGTKADYN